MRRLRRGLTNNPSTPVLGHGPVGIARRATERTAVIGRRASIKFRPRTQRDKAARRTQAFRRLDWPTLLIPVPSALPCAGGDGSSENETGGRPGPPRTHRDRMRCSHRGRGLSLPARRPKPREHLDCSRSALSPAVRRKSGTARAISPSATIPLATLTGPSGTPRAPSRRPRFSKSSRRLSRSGSGQWSS